jgi:tetratricopeptide (TPR) repeat protein
MGRSLYRALLISALAATGPSATALAGTAAEYHRRAFRASTAAKRIELLDRALAINPDHIPSLRLRSLLRSMLGKKENALADAARAASLDPDDFELNLYAAGLAEELDYSDRAVPFLRRAVAADRSDLYARTHYIRCLKSTLRADEALAEANRLVNEQPDADAGYSIRIDCYEAKEQFEKALSDVELLLKRHRDNAEESHYLVRRSMIYRAMGNGRKALADTQYVLRTLRQRSDQTRRQTGPGSYLFAARGCAYEVLGEKSEALADYRRAAEMAREEKDDTRFYTIWQCILLRKLDRRDESDKLATKYIKDELEKKDDWIAPVLFYLAGQMKEAEVFRHAKHENPVKHRQQMCEATYYIGACHMAAGDLDKAETLFHETLKQRVYGFYEHGFARRDLREIKKLREKKRREAKSGT